MKISRDILTDMDKKQLNKAVHAIHRRNRVSPLYVVTRPLFNDGILEIYQYNELLHEVYRKLYKDLRPLAISETKDGAIQLCAKLIEDNVIELKPEKIEPKQAGQDDLDVSIIGVDKTDSDNTDSENNTEDIEKTDTKSEIDNI